MPDDLNYSAELGAAGLPQDIGSHVLVLDDSLGQCRLLSTLLKKWGHRVTACQSPQEALKLAADPSISMILTDWIMPEMSGPEFCEAVRSLNRESYAYIILLTSKNGKSEIAHGLESGADDFVSKPVNAPELRARMRAGERIIAMQHELVSQNRKIHTNLAEIRELYDALDRDLKDAQRLQESLVRETYREFDDCSISLILRASGHVGGDLVGFFPINDERIGLYSLDVSGHGVSSALLASRMAGLLGPTPEQNVAFDKGPGGVWVAVPPDEVARRLNQIMVNEMETELYFTICFADLNLNTGAGQMVQAGHPHPAVLHPDGSLDWIGVGGLPVGLIPGAEFQSFDIQLTPGDRLMLYSDGITEMSDAEGTFLDEDGFQDILHRTKDLPGNAILPEIVKYLEAFAGTGDFDDDVSAVAFDFKREATGARA